MERSSPLTIWMPYTIGRSGSDVSTRYLAEALRMAGQIVHVQAFSHHYQFAPWLLRREPPPERTQITITNSWSGFAFTRPGVRSITVERLFVADESAKAYKSVAQGLFHDHLVARFVEWSYHGADAVVCLSQATVDQVRRRFPDIKPRLILNAVDTDFFTPSATAKPPLAGRVVRLMFVGNLTKRKGVDLLPGIMARLGDGYELRYTSGLRTKKDPLAHIPNALNLGRLSQVEVRQAYRSADLLLLPSRLEGLPRTVMEAQASGIPAIVSSASSLPEAIEDGCTGRVCETDNIASFVSAIRETVAVQSRYDAMCMQARQRAAEKHSLRKMVSTYLDLCHELLGTDDDCGTA